ncbi:hypothetical protein FACS1894186_1300 [Alphaproteobacteria bacterium]|nr:hypothetical protein FACS1894186_1300 [Alphaproteobacteria bacterium]
MSAEGISVIILAAGEKPSASIRGKLGVGWVVESVAAAHGSGADICVVLNAQDARLADYLARHYPEVHRLPVDAAAMVEKYRCPYNILHSLLAGMDALPGGAEQVEVVLGDSVCRYDSAAVPEDFVLVSGDIISSERWCIVEPDAKGNIKKIYDKRPNISLSGKAAAVGLYRFADAELLRKTIAAQLKAGGEQISAVLNAYNDRRPIAVAEAAMWLDLGHIDGIIRARNHFFNSRDFNSMAVDSVRGTIRKISSKVQKLRDEYDWYRGLPPDLQPLVPRVVGFEEAVDHAWLEMEMYGYPPLSELFVLGDMGIEEWTLILTRLFEAHRLFESHAGQLPPAALRELYIGKTFARLEELSRQNPYWQALLARKTVIINGREYPNLPEFSASLRKAAAKLVARARITVMHGDYCFNNILLDTSSFMVRLIDPRGRLDQPTIYGDPRYDIAKLRHSAVGGYDLAVHRCFRLDEPRKGEFRLAMDAPDFAVRLADTFDALTVKYGYDLAEIRLIEAMLFASMLPLHKDDFERQKVFYCKAVMLLGDIFGGVK